MMPAHVLPRVLVLFLGKACDAVQDFARPEHEKALFTWENWWAVTGSNRRPSRCKRERGIHSALFMRKLSCLAGFLPSQCPPPSPNNRGNA